MRARVLAVTTALVAIVLAVAFSVRAFGPATPAANATTSPTAIAAVPLAAVGLPVGCNVFDEGYYATPLEAGVNEAIRFNAAACAIPALDAIAASGRGIEITWMLSAFPDTSPTVRAVLTSPYDPAWTGERSWSGTVRFPEPGQWRSDQPLGGPFFSVVASDNGLAARSSTLPLPAAPQSIAVVDGSARRVLRTFSGERGGVGVLQAPDRVVFVQTRDSGRWLVTGDIATGATTPLFEVGPFANIQSAPDGRAMAVEWGQSGGRRELRIVSAAGKVTTIDDGTINPIALAWAPDSQTLIADGDSRWVIDADGAVRDRKPSPDLGSAQITWAPDATYALLWQPGQGAHLARLELASLIDQAVLPEAGVTIAGFAMAPDGARLAVGWQEAATDAANVSVLAAHEITDGTRLADRVVARFERSSDSSVDVGTLSWSPDGQRLAFARIGLPSDGTPPRVGSELLLLEVATGAVQPVAEAPDYYTSLPRFRAWFADSSILFALRFNCSQCGPSSSDVDVIDVAAGRVVATYEDTGYIGSSIDGGAQLLSTAAGLLRTSGRDTAELLVPFHGGLFFGAYAARRSEDAAHAFIGVQLGSARGRQVFAAQPDGSGATLLADLGFDDVPVAMLDATTAVVRGDQRWQRVDLPGGTAVPYIASSGAQDNSELILSPSKRLAIDLDRDGFAILDMTAPPATAVVPRRLHPAGIAGSAAWFADERHIAFSEDQAIDVFDVPSGDARRFDLDALGAGIGSDDGRVWAVTWAPAGALQFAMAGALWELDVETGAVATVAEAPRPGGFTQGTSLVYSPDGQTLAAATQFGVFVRSAGGDWKQLGAVGVPVSPGMASKLHWAPDSTAVAYAGEFASTPEGIIVAPLDGSGAYQLVAPGAVSVAAWLGDGRILWTSVTGGT